MKKIISIILLASMMFGISAFQCSSTELTSAKLYIQQKNYTKAIESLQKEIKTNPQSDEGYYLLGYVYGENGEIDKMLENFDKSLAISNKFEPNVEESKKYHWANNFNDGVKLFNKAAQAGGTDSSKIVFDESIAKFKNAIACEPDSIDTYTNLAYCYLNTNRNDEAIDVFKNQVDIFKKKYNLDSVTTDPSKGLSGIIKNEQTVKTLRDAYVEIGDLYVRKGSQLGSEKGLEYFNNAIDIVKDGRKYFPNNSDLLQILSNAYIGANKLDEAKEAFKEGVEKEPENKFYRYNYGSLLLNADEYSDAEVQLKKAL